jgi:hypothetical protein
MNGRSKLARNYQRIAGFKEFYLLHHRFVVGSLRFYALKESTFSVKQGVVKCSVVRLYYRESKPRKDF